MIVYTGLHLIVHRNKNALANKEVPGKQILWNIPLRYTPRMRQN